VYHIASSRTTGQISLQRNSRVTAKDWESAKIRIYSTPENKWASQKRQRPNMQWDKKEALSTSRESQERLGR
jgi:hypothetical protein